MLQLQVSTASICSTSAVSNLTAVATMLISKVDTKETNVRQLQAGRRLSATDASGYRYLAMAWSCWSYMKDARSRLPGI